MNITKFHNEWSLMINALFASQHPGNFFRQENIVRYTSLKHLFLLWKQFSMRLPSGARAGQATPRMAECFVFGVKVIVLLTRADEWYCQKRYCESCVERVGFEAWIPLCGVLEKD